MQHAWHGVEPPVTCCPMRPCAQHPLSTGGVEGGCWIALGLQLPSLQLCPRRVRFGPATAAAPLLRLCVHVLLMVRLGAATM